MFENLLVSKRKNTYFICFKNISDGNIFPVTLVECQEIALFLTFLEKWKKMSRNFIIFLLVYKEPFIFAVVALKKVVCNSNTNIVKNFLVVSIDEYQN